jgi:glucokinase
VSSSAGLFLDEAREHYAAAITGGRHRPMARIRTTQLGEGAGMIGAAELARAALGEGESPGGAVGRTKTEPSRVEQGRPERRKQATAGRKSAGTAARKSSPDGAAGARR